MHQWALGLAILFIFGCTSKPKAVGRDPGAIVYSIELIQHENKPALRFDLEFLSMDVTSTVLELPNKWASESHYYYDIKNLEVLTPGVQIEKGDKPFLKILRHKPQEKIRLRYVLTEQNSNGPQSFRAIVRNTYFHFIGHAAFIVPQRSEDAAISFQLEWKMPANYWLGNSFAAGSSQQTLKTRVSTLKHAVYVGGEFRHKDISVRGTPVSLALMGEWSFSDDDFFKSAQKIIEFQREFWKDDDFASYFVVLHPSSSPQGVAAGTGLTNSFTMTMSPNLKLRPDLVSLLSHEFFHTWNGQKIQRSEPDARYYWFSEGFTSYYSRLLNLRAGMMDLKEYVQSINELLYEYYTSPVKILPNTRVEKDFWKNRDIEKLPYFRGDLLALHWNSLIKTQSQQQKSLDDGMRALLDEAVKNKTKINVESLTEVFGKTLPSFSADVRAYIQQGNPITPDEKALGPCVKRHFISMGKFKYGFDRDKTYSSGVITNLKHNTPEHKAGLREGMKLVSREMTYPPFRDSKMKVVDHGVEKWVSFLPVTPKKFLMPHYVLDEKAFAADPQKCLAWFL